MIDPTAATSSRTPVQNSARLQILANAATAGIGLFIVLVLVLHTLQPELDPLRRFVSEYAVAPSGWLMKVAFLGLAASLASLSVAFGWQLRPPLRSLAAGILLAIASLGILTSAAFDSALQTDDVITWQGIAHDLAGFIAFLTLLPAMVAIAGRLRKNQRPGGLFLMVLAWVVIALFLAMLFLFEPAGLVGLGQRIFLTAMLGWLLVAARGLRLGAFTSAETDHAID